MAKLNKKILGSISGSLGDITFRRRNGKNYLASRPASFNVPVDQESINRRSKFARSVKLASLINSIPQLRILWEERITDGRSVFNELVRNNYSYINPDSISPDMQLTPVYGFGVLQTSAQIIDGKLKIVLQPVGTNAGIDTQIEKYFQLITVISLGNPLNSSKESNFLIPVVSAKIAVDLANPLDIETVIINQALQVISAYATKEHFSALITIDESENIIHYSSTFTSQIQ